MSLLTNVAATCQKVFPDCSYTLAATTPIDVGLTTWFQHLKDYHGHAHPEPVGATLATALTFASTTTSTA